MRKKIIAVLDDVDKVTPADVTIPFSYKGRQYKLDLTLDNAAELDADMRKWITHARRTPPRATAAPAPTPAAPTARKPLKAKPLKARRATNSTPRVTNETIRRWAREQNMQVADRGRIPVPVRRAFVQAHPSKTK